MLKHAKVMIWVNVLLGVLYVLFSLDLWITVNQWVKLDVAAEWSPLTVKPVFDLMPFPTHSLPLSVIERYNVPFILFCVMLAVNLYFLIRLQRSKETKQNPS